MAFLLAIAVSFASDMLPVTNPVGTHPVTGICTPGMLIDTEDCDQNYTGDQCRVRFADNKEALANETVCTQPVRKQ